jgi:nitrogen fixation protein NifU and related proteins
MMSITISVREDRIDDIKFESSGCGAAIAVSSIVTDMAKGKTLGEAMRITNKMVADAVGGLPKNELHCSNLGADALQRAIMDYYAKKEGKISRRKDEKVDHISSHGGLCYCPYCDVKLPREAPYCSNCGKPTLNHR